ncbi:MAG: 4Fe-4S binding protein [Spirochaetota bacterium]
MECFDQEACIGCLSCAEMCPEVAIQVTGVAEDG